MKRIVFYNIICFFLLANSAFSQEDFRKNAPKPGPAPHIELGKAEQFTLKNGLKVIVVENHKLPKVSFQVFVDVPPFMEGEYAGAANMAGQLLTKGTTTRTKSEIDEAVDFIGASLSSSATGVSGSSLTKHKDKLLAIMSDVLLNPVFPQDEFDKVKKQTLSALAQAKDDPNTIAANVAKVMRNSKNHPYGEVESEKTIEKITVDKAKEFYSTYFKPNISYLIVTGDITASEVKRLAPKYFGSWEKGAVTKSTFPAPERPQTTQVDFVDKTGAVQSVINITYPLDLKPGASDAIKASVMNTLLGGYFGSRFMSNLREDKAYTYGARSSLDDDPVIGFFNANASVRNEVTDSAIVQFLYELNRIRNGEIPESELEMVKSVMTGNFARSLERPETVARFALNIARYNLPEDYYATYLERLNKVSVADIKAMANKYILPDNAHILVVGNKDEVAEKLSVFSADKKVNYFDVYGNPVATLGLTIPDGVSAETILKDYVDALGTPSELAKIQNVIISMATTVQGMTMETTLYHQEPSKLSMINSMMGNIVQQSVFNGDAGYNMQMGKKTPMEGVDLEDMKVDAHLFPERFYKKLGVKTELKGMEMIDGKKAYKVVVEYPSGNKKIQFFDAETSLKIREIEQKGEATIINDLGDYKVINGVKFPHTLTVTGAAPFPLTLKTVTIEVNGDLDEEMFKVE